MQSIAPIGRHAPTLKLRRKRKACRVLRQRLWPPVNGDALWLKT